MGNCKSGEHQHLGAGGKKMRRCHSISEEHQDPIERQYHEMALMEGKSKDPEGLLPEKEDFISEETRKKIESNIKRIQASLKNIANNTVLKPLLAPIVATSVVANDLFKKSDELNARAKDKKEKAMAEEYQNTVQTIVKGLPQLPEKPDSTDDKEIKAYLEETIDIILDVKKDYEEKIKELTEAIKKNGTKDCPEYAQYRAYRDFQVGYENRLKAVQNRLNGIKRKQELKDRNQKKIPKDAE